MSINLVVGNSVPVFNQRKPSAIIMRKSHMYDSAEDLGVLLRVSATKNHRRQKQSLKAPRNRTCRALEDNSVPIERYDSYTSNLVATSTIPFLFLLLPQIIKNMANLTSGNPQALYSISWTSVLTGLGGNTLLLSYFSSKKNEKSAVLVQAIGIASSFIVMTQIRAAGFLPRSIYAAVAFTVAATALLTGFKLSGLMEQSKFTVQVWSLWQNLIGIAGLVLVPPILCSTLGISHFITPSIIISTSIATLLTLGDAFNALSPTLIKFYSTLSAWTATILFMLQPVAQLVQNFQNPTSMEGISVTTVILACIGNGLMVPRAVFTRDIPWSVGSVWGCVVFGWIQLLSLYIGKGHGGERFLSGHVFVLVSVFLFGWLGSNLYHIIKLRAPVKKE